MAAPSYRFPDYWSETDLAQLPDDGHRYEIVDGSLLVTPPPKDDHQNIGGNLYFVLRTALPAGWRVLYEVGVRVPGGNFIPDLVVLKPGAATGVEWREAGDVALVVEVASRSTHVTDRTLKAAKYAEAGIPSYWRVDTNGNVVVHSDLSDGDYQRVSVLPAGSHAQVDEPFPVSFDPADLVRWPVRARSLTGSS